MTTLAPETVGESLDPRDPLLRLSRFFDSGSVQLLHERDRSGVLAAAGTVNGVRTVAFATDGTVMGGAMGLEGCTHIVNAYDTAIEEQSPIVGIWHSGGARLAEGVRALHAVGTVFEAMIRASGYIPQISVVVGFAAGGAAYGPALTDVIVMAPESTDDAPVLRLIPKKPGQVMYLDIETDTKHARMLKATWKRHDGGTIVLTQTYSEIGAADVVTEQHATIDIPHMRAEVTATYTDVTLDTPLFATLPER